MNKNIIAVIGYCRIFNYDDYNNILNLSYNLGKLIIDNGYILANGCFGEAAEMIFKGAAESELYNDSSIIKISSNYNSNIEDSYIGLEANIIADALIVIGGSAETLIEISLAWKLGKLIIVLGDYGCVGKLAGTSLDDRRDDIIHKAHSPEEALKILNKRINCYIKFDNSIPYKDAKTKIASYFNINEDDLLYLGEGKEGIVYTDKKFVYKIIKNPKYYFLYNIHFNFISLSNKIKNMKENYLYPFEIFYNYMDLIIYYEYKPSKKITDKSLNLKMKDFQELLNKYYYSNIIFTGLRPENLLCYENGELFICDIG
ncbi:hypothetical protein, partial [Brachyspira sp.]|uniref:SLOG cluster 4 domain-containing protein n=1 Tax=Brachyspira sp. TaxID=1977261 RepID=UPI00261C154D